MTPEQVAFELLKLAITQSPMLLSFVRDAVDTMHGDPRAARVAEILPERSKSRKAQEEIEREG